MAEKVFQLLERLKLAEIGKTKAVEALRKQQLVAQKKKNSRLLKSTMEGKARVKAELDKKVLVDQIRALKKHNSELSSRCREEVKAKLKEHEDKNKHKKKRTLGGRLSFLLNKLQSDEEAKIVAGRK